MSLVLRACLFFSLFVLTWGSVASAAVVKNLQHATGSGHDTDFDSYIDTDDLINSGQSTFVGSTETVAPASQYYFLTGLNDGSTSKGYWAEENVVTFTLNTVTNPYGYDITEINTILGYNSHSFKFANHDYDISYSQVDAPSVFLPLYSAREYPISADAAGSSMLTLTSDAGALASGVAKIRFDMFETTGTTTTGIFREIDIQGQATPPVPEPSSLLLALGGLVAIRVGARRRRRARSA